MQKLGTLVHLDCNHFSTHHQYCDSPSHLHFWPVFLQYLSFWSAWSSYGLTSTQTARNTSSNLSQIMSLLQWLSISVKPMSLSWPTKLDLIGLPASLCSHILPLPLLTHYTQSHWPLCETAHSLGLFYLQALLLGYPSRYSHGPHFHYFQVSAAQKSLSHTCSQYIQNYPLSLLFPYLASFSFPELTIISHGYLLFLLLPLE